MKTVLAAFTIYLLSAIPALASTTNINNNVRVNSEGENSNVDVKIDNQTNTGSSTTSYSNDSKTDVHISQTGEGTSKVNINGKEYKVEGPGELNISSDETPSSTPTSKPNYPSNPSPTPNTSIIQEQINEIKELLNQILSLLKLQSLF